MHTRGLQNRPLLRTIKHCYAGLAQLFRARPCQGRGQGLESPNPHQFSPYVKYAFGRILLLCKDMNKAKLIFVSGLTGAGKTTLVGEALKAIDNLEVLLTYTTRPKRADEDKSYAYIFLSDDEYNAKKALSDNWDETTYKGYRYASDAEKFINDLNEGINVIATVTPNMDDIRAMAQIYRTQPVTIWINTDSAIAASRVREDKLRSLREEDDTVKAEFDILFEPTGDLQTDTKSFIDLLKKVVSG